MSFGPYIISVRSHPIGPGLIIYLVAHPETSRCERICQNLYPQSKYPTVIKQNCENIAINVAAVKYLRQSTAENKK